MNISLRSMLLALLVLAVAVPAAAQDVPGQAAAQSAAVVKAVTFVASETSFEATVTVSGECLCQTLVLADPSRLVLDFAPASGIEAKAITEVNAFGVTNIRTGMFQPMIARVIFDFSGGIPPYEIKKTATGFTVVFTKPEEAAAKAEAPQIKAEAPPVKAEEKPAAPVPQFERPARAEESADVPMPVGFKNTTIGVFGGTYSNPSSDFQEVYGSESTLQYGLNLTRTLLNAKGFQIDASFELRTFSKTGQATLSGDEAKIVLTPVTIAGRLLYQAKYIMPFIGFGADFYNYEETSALANTTGSASGAHFQAGFYIIFPKVEFLRLKAYYKYTKVTANMDGFDIGLGGPEYGFGLSFGFNALNKAVLMF
jgi:hypothetical protein